MIIFLFYCNVAYILVFGSALFSHQDSGSVAADLFPTGSVEVCIWRCSGCILVNSPIFVGERHDYGAAAFSEQGLHNAAVQRVLHLRAVLGQGAAVSVSGLVIVENVEL